MERLKNKKILFFVEEMYEDLELWYPRIRLKEEGAKTTVVGPEKKLYRGKNGYPCQADDTVENVSAKDYDALVIPGGYAPDKLRRYRSVLELTKSFNDDRKPSRDSKPLGDTPSFNSSAGILTPSSGS